MRKLIRARLRYLAEQYDGKTIKVFRYLWTQLRTKQGKEYVYDKPTKPKSMLRRGISRIGKRLGLT